MSYQHVQYFSLFDTSRRENWQDEGTGVAMFTMLKTTNTTSKSNQSLHCFYL